MNARLIIIFFIAAALASPKLFCADSASADGKIVKTIPLSEFFYADNPRYTITGDLPLKKTRLKTIPTIAFAGGLTAVFVAQHIGQETTIWKDKSEFRILEDISQDMWADKFGHFFGAYFTSYLLRESLIEIGVGWDASAIWGGALGLSYSTYVEILDGFGANWGFSPSDWYSDVAGAAFFVGQHYFPFLQNVTPKFIYYPAKWAGEKERRPHDMFIDDYSSQTFFFSFNVYNVLPKNLKSYWPSWLQLSVGYAARNLCDPRAYDCDECYSEIKTPDVWGSPRYILALDYDFVKLLPKGPPLWNWFRQTLNHFKFPSPALEFSSKGVRAFLLYPAGI